MDVCAFLLDARDRVRQFIVYWKAGATNKTDYYIMLKHHRAVRYNYLKNQERKYQTWQLL
jgi:hypothetical protein